MTTVTGTDVLNRQVVTLVQQNQSTNETNLVKSLNTNTSTDTNAYTTSDAKIFAKVIAQSTKKKTFGVYTTKQVVEDITPDTQSPVADKIEVISSDQLTNLSTKTGTTITTDIEYDRASRQALESSKETIDMSLSLTGDPTMVPFTPVDGSTDWSVFNSSGVSLSPLGGGSTSMPSYLNPTGNSSSVIPGIPGENTQLSSLSWKDNITRELGEVPSYDAPFGLDVNNYTDDFGVRSFVPETMSLENYKIAQDIMAGDFGKQSSCTDLNNAFSYDTNMFGIAGLLEGMNGMFDLGLIEDWLDCFDTVFDQIGLSDTLNLVDKVVEKGDIGAAGKLLSNTSGSIVSNPADTLFQIGNAYTAVSDPNTNAIITNLSTPAEAAKFDGLISTLDVDRASLFSTSSTSPTKNQSLSSSLDIVDAIAAKASNPSNGFLDFVMGSDHADLIRALPT